MLDSKRLRWNCLERSHRTSQRATGSSLTKLKYHHNYFEIGEALVIARESDREERILSEIRRIESDLQSKIPVDKELVASSLMTEYPSAVLGRFLEKLPRAPA